MRAGARDQRIVIETPTVTEDEMGQDSLSWVPQHTVWAEVREAMGREFLSGDYKAEKKAVFVTLWLDVDSTARIKWNDRVWRIEDTTGQYRSNERWFHCIAQDGAN